MTRHNISLHRNWHVLANILQTLERVAQQNIVSLLLNLLLATIFLRCWVCDLAEGIRVSLTWERVGFWFEVFWGEEERPGGSGFGWTGSRCRGVCCWRPCRRSTIIPIRRYEMLRIDGSKSFSTPWRLGRHVAREFLLLCAVFLACFSRIYVPSVYVFYGFAPPSCSKVGVWDGHGSKRIRGV